MLYFYLSGGIFLRYSFIIQEFFPSGVPQHLCQDDGAQRALQGATGNVRAVGGVFYKGFDLDQPPLFDGGAGVGAVFDKPGDAFGTDAKIFKEF